MYFLIYLQKPFFFLSEINNVQSNYERRKVSRRNFQPEVFRVVRQQLNNLTDFLSNVLLWHCLTFDSRANCSVIIFVEVVSGQFSQG